jgi:hypothetical protein
MWIGIVGRSGILRGVRLATTCERTDVIESGVEPGALKPRRGSGLTADE